jgi:FAD/FMN-containing dehydrogenase
VSSPTDRLPSVDSTVLPFGLGRSYGDSCLNSEGAVLLTHELQHVLDFDAASGTVVCEPGLSLKKLADYCLPHGWFLPVVPGTEYVSVGGAIANDVHGKNHHRAGTFGHHVVEFELLRSDDRRLVCSKQANSNWFAATIGGLGLTGLITAARLKLRPLSSGLVDAEDVSFESLTQFEDLSSESDQRFEYTVAWFDCYSYREGQLRGIFSRAAHVERPDATLREQRPGPRAVIPFTLPSVALAPAAVRLFNALYFGVKRRRSSYRTRLEHFLFPLDAIDSWNRAYGKRGFMQLQCVFPEAVGTTGVAEVLERIAGDGQGSFLAVLKRFGSQVSPGLLSFPMAGITLALDFQNRGERTLALLADCHKIVVGHGGRIYPAKDACMTASVFAASFPNWRDLLPFVDPKFSSDFWRRTAMALSA